MDRYCKSCSRIGSIVADTRDDRIVITRLCNAAFQDLCACCIFTVCSNEVCLVLQLASIPQDHRNRMQCFCSDRQIQFILILEVVFCADLDRFDLERRICASFIVSFAGDRYIAYLCFLGRFIRTVRLEIYFAGCRVFRTDIDVVLIADLVIRADSQFMVPVINSDIGECDLSACESNALIDSRCP